MIIYNPLQLPCYAELSDPVTDPRYEVQAVKLERKAGQKPGTEWIPFSEWLEKANNGEFQMPVTRARVLNKETGRASEPFAKTWQAWDQQTKTWYPTRLGLGAYGDLAVWRRNLKPLPGYTRETS